MLFDDLVDTSERVTTTTKRNEKIDLLAARVRAMSAEEIPIGVSYLSGALPQGQIGIGYATLKANVGEPAAAPSLHLLQVHDALNTIAGLSGKGSAARRAERLQALFGQATRREQTFLIGLLGGELRQGALEGVMSDAIAKAFHVDASRVRRAVMMAGSLAAVAEALQSKGAEGLTQFDIQLFRPVQPMLAGTAETIDDALEELGEAELEWKLDGARIQAHKSGDEVRVYSRRLNDVTSAVPEVVELMRSLPAGELILDGEVIALQEDGRPHAFQTTMRRFGRKLNVDAMRSDLPLQPFWFDLLYVNGTPAVDEPLSRRFSELQALVPSPALIPHVRTASSDQAQAFLKQALATGHEGVMAKAPDAPYAAGARGQNWLKVKQARTLDLIVLAAEWGNGRRQGFLSNLHLGARDTERGGWAMLGKTFKGLTDDMLAWQTQELLKLELSRDAWTVYVQPKLVVEIAFNEIQVSPRYESGLALRFARVKRYRTDKGPDQTDTFATVQAMAGQTA